MNVGLIAHDGKKKPDAEFLHRISRHFKQT